MSTKNPVVVITGATNGIGRATASALAARGANLILACRNIRAAEAAREEIAGTIESTRNEIANRPGDDFTPSISIVELDLASLESVRRAASEIGELRESIDVLINNAGTFSMRRLVTIDGFEMTMGVNHLGHFAFTLLLLPLLRSAPSARIINVGSDAHLYGRIDFDDFFMQRRYRGFRAYAASRLATVLFTRELAERLGGTGITVNSLHPGHVMTNMWNLFPNRRLLGAFTAAIMKRFLMTPAEGAATSVFLATSGEAAALTGKYFVKCEPAKTNPICEDRDVRMRLWKLNEEHTGVSFSE